MSLYGYSSQQNNGIGFIVWQLDAHLIMKFLNYEYIMFVDATGCGNRLDYWGH